MERTIPSTTMTCFEPVYAQSLRREETQEAVVPDTLPDIGEILHTTGGILIRSKDVGEGRVRLEANVPAIVTYRAEDGAGLYGLDINIPLYISIEDEKISEQSQCMVDLRVTGLESKMLNPRKVSVRAETLFQVTCYAPAQFSFPSAGTQSDDGVHVLERTVTVSPVCCVTEKTFVLTDEFTVPENLPASAVILSQHIRTGLDDVKAVGNKLVVKGNVVSSLLFAGEGMDVSAVEFSTDFSQIVDAEPMPETASAAVQILLSGAYYDLRGGNGQTGEMELHFVIQAVVSGNQELTCLTDVYSNRYELETSTEQCEADSIRSELTLRETLREQFPTAQSVAEILQGCVELGIPETEDGFVTLPVTVWIHYRATDGTVNTGRHRYPVRFSCELASNQSVEPLSAAVQEIYLSPSTGGAELRIPLELRAFLREKETISCVTGFRYDETQMTDLSDAPTIVILMASSRDNLWTLARENRSTVQAITQANALDEGETWEKLILIPKTI